MSQAGSDANEGEVRLPRRRQEKGMAPDQVTASLTDVHGTTLPTGFDIWCGWQNRMAAAMCPVLMHRIFFMKFLNSYLKSWPFMLFRTAPITYHPQCFAVFVKRQLDLLSRAPS
jgi:hypothetical protein